MDFDEDDTIPEEWWCCSERGCDVDLVEGDMNPDGFVDLVDGRSWSGATKT